MPRRNRNVNRSRYQVESVDLGRVEESPAMPPLPSKPAARRRALRVRGW